MVLVALAGDYGKPRPAVIVQSDAFNPTHESYSIVPTSTTLLAAPIYRLTIEPSASNGLRRVSQLAVDKLTVVRRDRIGATIGRLEDDAMLRLTRAMAVWLGLTG